MGLAWTIICDKIRIDREFEEELVQDVIARAVPPGSTLGIIGREVVVADAIGLKLGSTSRLIHVGVGTPPVKLPGPYNLVIVAHEFDGGRTARPTRRVNTERACPVRRR